MTDEIESAKSVEGRRGVKGHLASKANLDSYERYAKFRELIETDAARRQAPSASAAVSGETATTSIGCTGIDA